jgi:hypothetical protein
MGVAAAANQSAEQQVVTESVFGYRQENGRFDDRDRMEAKLIIERIELRQTVNGTAKAPTNLGDLVGRSITAIFDREGKLIDLTVPQDLQQVASVLKQLAAGAYGPINFLPPVAMEVGKTEKTLSPVPIRLSAGPTVPYQTQTATTLRAVEKEGSDRIARFEQHIDTTAQTDKVKVTGGGTIDVNLDRGFVSASTTEWNFSGTEAIARTSSAQPATVRGSLKVTVAAHP